MSRPSPLRSKVLAAVIAAAVVPAAICWKPVARSTAALSADDAAADDSRPWLGAAARALSVDERVELLAAKMTQPEKVA